MNAKLSRIMLLATGCALLFSQNCSLQAADVTNESLQSKMIKIVNYGALAPSSHNAQMWQVSMSATDKIYVLLDRQRLLTQVDHQNREALISLGAFIENLVVAAPAFNLQAEVRILTPNMADPKVAELTFHPRTGPAIDNVLANIKNRHTIRFPYLRQELRESELKWVKNLGADFRYFSSSSKEGKYLQTAIIAATQQQVAQDHKQRELAGLIYFSPKEAAQKKDGLTPDGMGLSKIAKCFVTTFYNHDTVMSQSFRKQTVNSTKRQANNCSGFLVITGDDSVAGRINSGRLLERFWLMATERKLAVHPMSAPLEESPWKDTIAQKLETGKPVQMILRVGYVKNYGHPVSQRRPISIIK